MTNHPMTVLVTGATGQQGGAVSRALARRGHRVRALTRDPESESAMELKRHGATVRGGDFDDIESLKDAMTGCDAAFIMGTPFERGPDLEERQSRAVALAANRARIDHVVYSSVSGANRKSGIPHFESKYRVEEYLATLDTPFTILRPVFFMENLVSRWILPALREGTLSLGLPASRSLQLVAVDDIGEMVAHVLENRDWFTAKRIDLASDETTCRDLAKILSRTSKRTIRYEETAIEKLRTMSEDMALTFVWLNGVGYDVNIERLHRNNPEVPWHRFEAWCKSRDWSILGPATDASRSETSRRPSHRAPQH